MSRMFYFWSGSKDTSTIIPEGNFNGMRLMKINLTVGGDDGHGIDWNKSENAFYKGKPYMMFSFHGLPRNIEANMTLDGTNTADTLIVRYVDNDPKHEKIFKKQSDESFVIEFHVGGEANLVVKKTIDTLTSKSQEETNVYN